MSGYWTVAAFLIFYAPGYLCLRLIDLLLHTHLTSSLGRTLKVSGYFWFVLILVLIWLK